MSPRKKKEDNSGVTPLDQINSYLEQNKGDHYNFEEERNEHSFDSISFEQISLNSDENSYTELSTYYMPKVQF